MAAAAVVTDEQLNELRDKLIEAAEQLVTLKIVTIVGNFTIGDDDVRPTPDVNSKTMYTEIDLLQGDITSMIDERLLTTEFNSIRELHTAREENGHTIITANMNALIELVRTLRESLPAEPASP